MKFLFYGLLLLGIAANSVAQERKYGKWHFALISEAISMPSYKVIKAPIHPGCYFGVSLMDKTKHQHSHIVDANFGYYYHKLFGNSFLLWPEYKFEQAFFQKGFVNIMFGIGYKHNILDRTIYKAQGDGKFEKAIEWGNPQFFTDLGLGLGYRFNDKLGTFCHYRVLLAAPFMKGMKFSMHTIFNMGIQYNFSKNNSDSAH